MSLVEIVAVLFSIIYVILAAKENNWCWLSAVISVSLYIYLCFEAQLYLETGLQIFYLFMAGYGFSQWKKPKIELPIKSWSIIFHLKLIFIGIVTSIAFGKLAETYTDAALPLIDAFTTIFSLFATFMVTRKILENWIYWIVIDAVSIYLYYSRDFHLTAALFVAYTIIAAFGYLSWKKEVSIS